MRLTTIPLARELATLVLLCAVPAAAAGALPAGGGRGVDLESYWGILPAPVDSVTAAFGDRPVPFWERALLLPRDVASLPLRGLAAGAEAGFVYLDERRITSRIRSLLGPRTGPVGFALNATAGGAAGLGGGITFLHDALFSHAARGKLRTQLTEDGGYRATLGLESRGAARDGWDAGAGVRRLPSARYFGTGPASRREDKSLYEERQAWAAVGTARRLHGPLALEARATLSRIEARKGPRGGEPPLAETFAAGLPPGYGRASDAVSWSMVLRHDTTSEDGRPENGGVRRALVARTDELGSGRNSFWTVRADLEQLVGLWNAQQTLTARAFVAWNEPVGDSRVPFQRLMTNDDPDLLRGYQDLRFRDRGMGALALEYRWPAWAERTARGTGIDAYLLADFGQVFGAAGDVSADRMTESYGAGLRFLNRAGFVGRLEVAWSEEETKVRVRADQVFQFAKGGLYHGRSPVPPR